MVMLTRRSGGNVVKRVVAGVAALVVGLGFVDTAVSWADVPTPDADQIVLTFPVNGDRNATGIRNANGVAFQLVDYSTRVPYTASWATCTTDAAGDCSFTIPMADVSMLGSSVGIEVTTPGWMEWTYNNAQYASPPIDTSSLVAGETYPASRTVYLERDNPALPVDCGANGLKVAFVVDLSGSMRTHISDLKTASKAYVDALAGTDTQIALFTFEADAPAADPDNANRPLTSVGDQAGVDQVKQWIDQWTAMGLGTNWSDGIYQVSQSGEHFDFVIFITDGLAGTKIDVNIASANVVKALGTRIFTVIVTTTAYLPEDVMMLSGPVHDDPDVLKDDYFMPGWEGFLPVLNQLTSVCPAPKVDQPSTEPTEPEPSASAPVAPAPAPAPSATPAIQITSGGTSTGNHGGMVAIALVFMGAGMAVVLRARRPQ